MDSYQIIPTSGAIGVSAFVMNGEDYLCFTNSDDGTFTNVFSVLYKWDVVTVTV